MTLNQNIEQVRMDVERELSSSLYVKEVEAVKVKYLGKKSPIQQLMRLLKDMSEAERPLAGKLINDLKEQITVKCDGTLDRMLAKEEAERLQTEILDVTLPGRRRFLGRPHVVMQLLDQVIDILVGMGFSVQYGPDVETDYYNFEALNFAHDHPARDMQDTFYVGTEDGAKRLLRTHTSNTQVRVMEQNKPPIRIIAPGKCYRNEDVTARSHVLFHQVEGLYIDKNVSFADLMATLREFLQKLFDRPLKTRFRPSYFPFVEPGMEVDVECLHCNGQGCGTCKRSGWLEVLGAGMVHPQVLRNGGLNPEEYSGYAWGMGIERLLMIKCGVPDIRFFMENDIRFLRQFA